MSKESLKVIQVQKYGMKWNAIELFEVNWSILDLQSPKISGRYLLLSEDLNTTMGVFPGEGIYRKAFDPNGPPVDFTKSDDERVGSPFEAYSFARELASAFEAAGFADRDKRIKELEEALSKMFRGAEEILSMAQAWAEGGGDDSPEMLKCEAASADIYDAAKLIGYKRARTFTD